MTRKSIVVGIVNERAANVMSKALENTHCEHIGVEMTQVAPSTIQVVLTYEQLEGTTESTVLCAALATLAERSEFLR